MPAVLARAKTTIVQNAATSSEGQGRAWSAACLAQVSLLVALIYLALGALRLGWATALLSKPIISAFLTAGALIISLSQACTRPPCTLPHCEVASGSRDSRALLSQCQPCQCAHHCLRVSYGGPCMYEVQGMHRGRFE